MPPVAAAEEEQHYAALMEDILAFQEKGQVVVLGDFIYICEATRSQRP